MESESIITTSNGTQYLRPDYLTPLPTILDAKKSPLALLAQTCSQIGADTPNSKTSLIISDKNSNNLSLKKDASTTPTNLNSNNINNNNNREKSSPVGSISSLSSCSPKSSTTFRPYDDDIPVKSTRIKTSHKKECSPRSSPSNKLQERPGSKPQPASPKPSSNPTAAPYLPYLASPFFGYSRASKPGEHPPLCRDPFCTGSCNHMLSAKNSPCPAGCLQCDKSYLAYAQLAALAASQPYVCPWVGADATSYCGKRFSTPDELLQHLRIHTSDSLLSHSLLHRAATAYPPINPAVLSARYHPYGKPPTLLPPHAFPPIAHLPPYFSPYSIYGPRLGASHP